MADRLRPGVGIALVYASTTMTWVSYSLLAVVLPFRFQAVGLSVVEYGSAVAILALGMLLTESVWGAVAFRLSSRTTILALGAAVAAVYVAIGGATSFATLAVLLGLLGALLIFQVPLMRWMALTALGPGTGGQGTGMYGLFSGLGLIGGTALGPGVYESVGFGGLMAGVVGTYAVGIALTLVLPWHTVPLPSRHAGVRSQLRGVLARPFLVGAVLVSVAFVAKSLILNFLQYYSIDVFGGTPTQAGYVIGSALAVSLLAGFLLGSVVDRWGAGHSTSYGFVVLTLGMFGTWTARGYPEMVATTLVSAAGLGWLSASVLPFALAAVPAPSQGAAVGVFGSFEDLGLLIGPIGISAVYAADGPSTVFLLIGTISLAGAAGSFALQRSARSTVGRVAPVGPPA